MRAFLQIKISDFEPGWLEPLVSALREDPTIGRHSRLILLYPETHLINSRGNALHYLGFGFTRDYRQPLPELFVEANGVRVFWLGTGGILIDAALQIGLFDESYFMYHEDTDLSWRLRSAGYHTIVVPRSRATHEYEFSRSIKKFYFIERNRLLTLFRNYEARTLFLILPMLAFWEEVYFCIRCWEVFFYKKPSAKAKRSPCMDIFLNPKCGYEFYKPAGESAGLRRLGDRGSCRVIFRSDRVSGYSKSASRSPGKSDHALVLADGKTICLR